jgi:HlyD family secretion protein
VPNAALRFRPVETAAPAGGGGVRDHAPAAGDRDRAVAQLGRSGAAGGAAASELLQAAAGAPRGERRQTLYTLGPDGEPQAVEVRTGITDGRYTAIVEGEIEPGTEVITGLATSRVEATGTFPGAQPPRGGVGRR